MKISKKTYEALAVAKRAQRDVQSAIEMLPRSHKFVQMALHDAHFNLIKSVEVLEHQIKYIEENKKQ